MFGFPPETKIRLARMNNPQDAINMTTAAVDSTLKISGVTYRIVKHIDLVMGVLTFITRVDGADPFLTMVYQHTPCDISAATDTSGMNQETAKDVFLRLQGLLDRNNLAILDKDFTNYIVEGLTLFDVVERQFTEDEAKITITLKPIVDQVTFTIKKVKE